MLTTSDIRKLLDSFSQVFATKEELHNEIYGLREEFNLKFQDVLTKLDSVYKDLHDFRLEQSMHVQAHRDIDTKLGAIEKVPTVAHELKKKN